jgi:catechol 2,3-dioxygenase-like lactoylglutathione lyase family enzyme
MSLRITTLNLSAPDAQALAAFYQRLLGWTERDADEADWVTLVNPEGGVGLAFQSETVYARPVWPATADHQQMMAHLEIQVDDLATATAHAESCGAEAADFQPQPDVRVYLDPAGHPFCLYL